MPDLKIEITAELGRAKENLALLKQELNDLNQSLKRNDSAIAGLNKQLAGLNTSTKEGKNAAAGLKAQLQTLAGVNSTLVKNITEVKGAIAVESDSLKKLGKDLKTAENSSNGFASGIGKAFAGLRTLANIIPGIGIGGLIGLLAGPLVDAFASLFISTKKATEEQKKFAASLDEVRSKGIATGLELQGFVNIAKDQTQSLDTRNEALRQANKIMGEHGEKLTLLNVATKEVTEQINKFTEATIQQALASKFADRAADLLIKQKEASKAYGKQLDETNKQLQQYVDFQKLATAPGSGLEDALVGEAVQLKLQKARLKESGDAYKAITVELGEMKGALADAQTQASSLFGELGTKVKVAIPKAIKEIKPEVEKALQHVFGKTIHLKTSAEILFDLKQVEKEANDKLGKAKIVPVKIPIDVTKDPFAEARASALAFQKVVDEQIIGFAVGAFEQLGESIGDALSGATDPIGSFFGGIADILAKSLKSLGKYVIETSTIIAGLKKALNAAFAGNPFLGVVAGVALIAIGSALEKALPKFADGVTNFGGGLALVGERGPEVVRLPKGSDVIPNHQLGGIGGGAQVFIPDVRIRGNDLVLVFNRASATIGRNG